jgi:hypothetical protein
MPAKKKSGHKPNEAAKRNRAIYKAEGRCTRNKIKKAKKEEKKQQKLLKKNKGIYAKRAIATGPAI